MDKRKLQIIAQLLEALEGMDGEHLKNEMAPPPPVEGAMPPTGEEGPMEALMAQGSDAGSEMGGEEEMSDEELRELENL